MKIHYLQHVEFEDPAGMLDYFKKKNFIVSSTKLYLGEDPPSPDSVDLLIVMGGPMGVYDEDKFPWLRDEKKFIRNAIDTGKSLIGVCLGAQLIAEALGAEVSKNRYREIGWYPVKKSPRLNNSVFDSIFPEQFDAFHWHGDTFTIPEGAIPIGSTEACENQGFVYNEKILAFQFHLETTYESTAALIRNCGDEIDGSRYVQSRDEVMSQIIKLEGINDLMNKILDYMTLKKSA